MWPTGDGSEHPLAGRPFDVKGAGRWLAFTLIELLVSMTVLVVIMLAVVSMVNQTGKLWKGSAARVEAFQNARAAFEAITRKVSQATLNTYWDYSYPGGDRTRAPSRYVRQSELHFVSGPAADLLARADGNWANLAPVQTHAVFFQAPLGYTLDSRPLNNVLNACGYYLEFGSDKLQRPGFLNPPGAQANTPELIDKLRFRFRLMELLQPSEKLSVYNSAAATQPAAQRSWFTDPVNANPATLPPVHVLAENILALVILPQQLAPDPSVPSAPLTPDYQYDSRVASLTDLRRHQLPPLVEITMVAIDEPSAVRLDQRFAGQRGGPQPYPPLADANGNVLDASGNRLFQDVTQSAADLEALEKNLTALQLNYRVFHTTLAIRGARWSER